MAPRKKVVVETLPKKAKVATETKVAKEFGPFDFITAVSDTKINLVRNSDNPEATAKLYNSFLTNRALSYHVSSIMDANVMNQCHQLPPLLQFEFLLNTVRREKRFSKWHKAEKDETLDMLAAHYECSLKRAIEIRSILPPDQVEAIRNLRKTGGVNKQ